MTWRATILTLFPEMFPGPLATALAGKRPRKRHLVARHAQHPGQRGLGRHRSVDDTPVRRRRRHGDAPGRRGRRHPAKAADSRPLVYLTPRGRPFRQDGRLPLRCRRRRHPALRPLRRHRSARHRCPPVARRKISIGDYVLSGGELAAMVVLDACIRLLPGVMGAAESAIEESFATNLLEYPHYTRPAEWQGHPVPGVLLSGDHAAIARWRQDQAMRNHHAPAAPICLRPIYSRLHPASPRRNSAFRRTNDDEPHPGIRGRRDRPPDRRSARCPQFAPGDTLRVSVNIKEGERSRVQAFEGVCIARSNKGLNSNFTVRKISYGEGVERVFPLYAPTIAVHRCRASRRCAPRQAVLSARPPRQVGAHRREGTRYARDGNRRSRVANGTGSAAPGPWQRPSFETGASLHSLVTSRVPEDDSSLWWGHQGESP